MDQARTGAAEAAEAAIEAGLAVGIGRAPAGVTIRRFRDAADFDGMAIARNAAARADNRQLVVDGERLAGDITVLGLDPATALLLAEDDGAVAGWIRIRDAGMDPEVGRVLEHLGCVDPAYRRRGIGGALLAGAQAALRERLAADPVDDGVEARYSVHVTAGAIGARAMLDRDGYRPHRWMYNMIRPSLDNIPDVDLPPGIDWRPAGDDTFLQISAAMDEAMHDHPGWSPLSEEMRRSARHHPLFGQVDVWQVAWDGDEVVGGVLGFIDATENASTGRQRGYTEMIFTRRAWRKRGIAAALIARNLRLLRERGMTEAALSVDTENPSGALPLYRRMGFEVENEQVTMQRPVGG
jgi:mycothiol synthase